MCFGFELDQVELIRFTNDVVQARLLFKISGKGRPPAPRLVFLRVLPGSLVARCPGHGAVFLRRARALFAHGPHTTRPNMLP